MYLPFEKIPDHSRIWIYQSNRKFSTSEIKTISIALKSFTEGWQVHGQPMDASFDLRFDQFIILAANDQASGCSIDGSVRVIKEIGMNLGIDFFNRTQIAFRIDDEVVLISTSELKKKYDEGFWNGNLPTFNNLADTKAALANSWLVAAGSTWLKRYVPSPEVIS